MSTPFRALYLCRDCAAAFSLSKTVATRSRRHRTIYHPLQRYATTSAEIRKAPLPPNERPFRIGIVGSGPAGFYAATRILERNDDAVVDMYEKLPAPFGLVRYGVAPDHPEVKNCQERFEQVAQSPRFNFIGNVAVGRDIPLRAMKPHYDAILFAYGASEDKALGVPGENLDGIYSARSFVAWYNGLPEFADLNPDLSSERAVVIGNGNVALDVARILLSELDKLKRTDISEHAMATLSQSKVKRVAIVGRRGPMQASFTMKELREMMNIPRTGFQYVDMDLVPQQDWISRLPKLKQRRYRMAKLLEEGSTHSWQNADKHWSLLSLLSPASFNPGTGERDNRLESITFTKNRYADPENRFEANAYVTLGEEKETLETGLAFRSIGYKSATMPGLLTDLQVPFDDKYGVIPNEKGRVVSSADRSADDEAPEVVPGCYCTGWVKRGPTGVIASTMDDAFNTADAILKDWSSGATFLNGSRLGDTKGTGTGWAGVLEDTEVRERDLPRRVSWNDWLKIDQAEKQKGKSNGKPREKFRSQSEMLQVLE